MAETAAEIVEPNDTVTAPPEAAPAGQPTAEASKATPSDGAASLAGAGGGEDKPVAAPADWPEYWRAKVAGDDPKFMQRLERMQSPADVAKAWRALEVKMSSGEMKAPLPEGATPEQVAAWRKDNGIPEAAEGYLAQLPEGVVLGDEDKPYAQEFAQAMHELNAPPQVVAKAIAWDRQRQEKMAEARAESDKTFRRGAEDELRGEWGAEYRSRMNAIGNLLDATNPGDDPNGASFKDLFLGARLSDGTVLGDNPLTLRWMAGLSSEINPAGTVVPGSAGSQAQSVADEIAEIEGVMRTNRAAYNKDAKMQERLRTLYEAQEKLASRGA